MKEQKYLITYIDDKGKCKTIERKETEEELKERIQFYIYKGFEIVAINKEVVTIEFKPVNWKEVIK